MFLNMSRAKLALLAVAGAQLASAQTSGTADAHPGLTTYRCTTSGGCVSQKTSVVIDYQYHWIHSPSGSQASCTTSSGVNSTLCPDQATCDKNCVIDGTGNYTSSGVTTSDDTLTMYQYVQGANGLQNSSPRLYLLAADGKNYEQLQLLGQELTFDVDLSTLPCGENGALYLSEMAANGGSKGQAAYGAGYCDAQCPVSTWRNGTINYSNQGFCCNEMDILEGNSRANAFTPHPCNSAGTDCDKGGCGLNPYAQGHQNYWGPGGTVDTSKKMTVITQFITDNGKTTGTLSQITRKYIQNGRVVASAIQGGDTITTQLCNQWDSSAATFGSLPAMGQALGRGMTLVFSIWNDNSQFMNWLDSGSNGPCSATEGDPSLIMKNAPNTHVTFSNIRWGDIGSTTSEGSTGGGSDTTTKKTTSTTTTSTTTQGITSTSTKSFTTTTTKASSSAIPTTTTSKPSQPQQTHWGQCGGSGYTGPSACESPYSCKVQNAWYSQCL
ncbi:hypothetical protein NLU13_8794 [Sarocladium strictum]|uniref:Glucanase n=1 Tax=Sarocladium strictum TaxID=5046 RepID=A0AA39L3K6_SARSR|nr:hypothetical protein NLU13_8794 [Sarocladium strictum]